MTCSDGLEDSHQRDWSLATDLDSRHPNRKACSCFFLSLIDEFEKPGDGTRDYTQSLQRVITANHRVGFSWKTQKK